MTRKDYIKLAEALRYARGHALANPCNPVAAIDDVLNGAAEYIANALANDNGRFDRTHFLAVVRGEKSLTSRPPR